MSDDYYYRWNRIKRLFGELEYEITRGVMEQEIAEEIGFDFVIPVSQKIPHGVVIARFRMRPETRIEALSVEPNPVKRLWVVE